MMALLSGPLRRTVPALSVPGAVKRGWQSFTESGSPAPPLCLAGKLNGAFLLKNLIQPIPCRGFAHDEKSNFEHLMAYVCRSIDERGREQISVYGIH
jgi:hypothetical protein